MRNSIFVFVLVGVTALGSGCVYSRSKLSDGVVRDGSGSSETPAEAEGLADTTDRTATDGTTDGHVDGSGDETILPPEGHEGGERVAGDGVAGEGVADEPTEEGRPIGTPPVIDVELTPSGIRPRPGDLILDLAPKCYKQFAYVHKEDGVENIVFFDGASNRPVTSNTYDPRTFRDLAFKAGTTEFAVTDSLLIGIVPIQAVLFGDLADFGDPRYLDAEGSFASSLTWNRDGSQYAYIAKRGVREEIRLVDTSAAEPREGVIASNEADRGFKFDKVVWAGDRLVYSAHAGSGPSRLYVVDNFIGTYRSRPLVRSRREGFDPIPRHDPVLGFEPAATLDGSKLAFVAKIDERRADIHVCALGTEPTLDPTSPAYVCADEETITRDGKNETPAWTPDGKQVFFASERPTHPGHKDIYRIDLNDRILTRQLTLGDAYAPAVVPVAGRCGE